MPHFMPEVADQQHPMKMPEAPETDHASVTDREIHPPIAQGTLAHSRRWIAATAYTLLLMAAFGRQLVELASYVAGTDLHSHILLVPFVTAYLLWINRDRLPRGYSTAWPPALVAGALATALLLTGHFPPATWGTYSRNDQLAIVALAFVGFVVAGGFLFLGRRWMSAAAFPVGFLVFLAPLPDSAVHALETGSKYASAEVAYLFFEATGTPILRDGLFFKIPGITLEVAQECSGIRSSWVLFITSLVASYLFLETPWRRAALVAVVFPLAIIRNGFRILVIGLLCVHIGPEMVHSVIHKRGGPLFFALSLIPLFAIMWLLRRGEKGAADTGKRKPETGKEG